jgi:hypothetical protein
LEAVARLYHKPVNYIQDSGHMTATISESPPKSLRRNDTTKDRRAVLCFDFNRSEILETKVEILLDSAFQVSVLARFGRMGLSDAGRNHSGSHCGMRGVGYSLIA